MRIGPHTTKIIDPHEQRSLARGNDWGVFQTFGNQPRTRRVSQSTPSLSNERDPLWVFHAPYPVHFVSGPEHLDKDVLCLKQLAQLAAKVGASYIVVHLGRTKDQEAEAVVEAGKQILHRYPDLVQVLREGQVKILVENVAAKYPTNQDLKYIREITSFDPAVLGWCLDFAHANAAGVCWDQITEYLQDPHKRPEVIHCNYPGSKRGSGLDRHGWFYKDETPIEAADKAAWLGVVKVAIEADIPLVMEGSKLPGDKAAEILAVKALS